MSNDCKICNHPNRLAIDREIVQGKNLRKLAFDYKVPYHSLYNHSEKHVSRQMIQAFEKQELIEGHNLLGMIEQMLKDCQTVFKRNFDNKRDLMALKAIDSKSHIIQMLSNVAYQLLQSKLAQLEIDKKLSGEDEESIRHVLLDKMKIFNDEELLVWQRLLNKLNNQNADVVINNNRVRGYNRPKM